MLRLASTFVAALILAYSASAETDTEMRVRVAFAFAQAQTDAGRRTADPIPEPKPVYHAFRWTSETPGQLTFWDGDVQAGAYRLADEVYLRLAGGEWFASDLPYPLPLAAKPVTVTTPQAKVPNKGSCKCNYYGGPCLCQPASKCAQGGCPATPQPPRGEVPPPTFPVQFPTSFSGVCVGST